MDIKEARKLVWDYEKIPNPNETDDFLYTEAMEYLIEEKRNPEDMLRLGGWYYEKKIFGPALRWYETAADLGSISACEGLGYIWYYGRTGKKDYEKAFKYYSKAKEAGILEAAVKIADMYKNGYYVEKDYDKYCELVEELYPKVKNTRNVYDPLPEVFTRLAHIRAKQGRTDEAIELYLRAKDFQWQRLKYNNWFGDVNIMLWLIDDLYALTPFDEKDFDLYDMSWLLKEAPAKVRFLYRGKPYTVEAVIDDDVYAIRFNGRSYPDRNTFYARAGLNGHLLTALYEDLYGFKIIKEDAE